MIDESTLEVHDSVMSRSCGRAGNPSPDREGPRITARQTGANPFRKEPCERCMTPPCQHGAACLRSPASRKIQDRLFKTRQRRSHIVEQGAVREGQARRKLANSWVFPEYVSQGGVYCWPCSVETLQGLRNFGRVPLYCKLALARNEWTNPPRPKRGGEGGPTHRRGHRLRPIGSFRSNAPSPWPQLSPPRRMRGSLPASSPRLRGEEAGSGRFAPKQSLTTFYKNLL